MATETDCVSVWCQLTEECHDGAVNTALQTLSRAERARADRFVFGHDRRDYVLAHALLRTLLSTQHGVAPCTWEFGADTRGKPFIIGNSAPFSLSHTRGCVSCAASPQGDVGVDVESRSRWREIQQVVAASEREQLMHCGDEERRVALVDLWTLKEATLKALGLGLAIPLHEIGFRLDGPRIECHADSPVAHDGWHFAIFAPSDLYRVAVAVRHTTETALAVAAQRFTSGGCQALQPVRTSSGPLAGSVRVRFADAP